MASGAAAGGAIYLEDTEVTSITGDFKGNYASGTGSAAGGAIYLDYTEVTSITGDFTGNYASATLSATGGAIFTSDGGKIENITGSFNDNYAEAGMIANGGALYLTDETFTLEITGDFENNRAVSGYTATGGAITGYADLTITGNLKNNCALAGSGDAYGGAAYITIGGFTLTGDITGNYAISEESNAYGGALTLGADTESTDDITGKIAGNYAEAENGNALGGALYTSHTTSIKGDIENNHVTGGDLALGGAIYSKGLLTAEGNFTGNYAEASGDAYGGAVAVLSWEIDDAETTLTGDFKNNHVQSSSGNAYGGAVLNYYDAGELGYMFMSVTGNFTGNYAEAENGEAQGGAVWNSGFTRITGDYMSGNSASGLSAKGGAVYNGLPESGYFSPGFSMALLEAGAFSGNSAIGKEEAYGGAMYNESYLYVLEGTELTGNYAESETGGAYGGAIYNTGSIGTYTGDGEIKADTLSLGDVTGNHVSAAGDALGGAIYNEGAMDLTADSLSGNYAESADGFAQGGAIYTEDAAGSISVTGDISGNWAAGTDAAGGAIYLENGGSITVTGNVTGNYASGTEAATGGAIAAMDRSDITISGSLTGNYAESTGGDALGGAISLADGSLTIEGDVTGNYAEAAGTAMGGAIVNMGEVTITGSITGNRAEGDTAAGGAIYNGGTVNINIENQDAVISGNKTVSGGTEEANVLYGTADSVTNFSLTDASLTLEDSLNGETGFEVNVTGNGTDSTTFYMYNDILDSNLSFSGTTINTINNEVKTYSVNKLSINGNVNIVADVDMANETMDRFTAAEYGNHAGKLNVSGMNLISDTEADRVDIYFAEEGLKDSVTSSVGTLPDSKNQQKAYTPLYQYNVAYDNRSDGGYFTFDKAGNNPSADVPEEGEAAAISFMNLMYRYAFEHSDYYMKLPKKVRLAIMRGEEGEAEKEFKNYNGHNLTDPGIWVKPFASNETVPFSHQFTARTKNYGLLVGIDTAFKERGKWANVFTGYAGYDGIKQTFDGNSTEQYGGVVGVTDTLYKGNFYAALTLSGGENVLKAKTMYGREKTHLYMAGAAVKTGYNLEFAGGNYSFLPTFMASYTYADIKDYNSASGLRMDSDGMHAVELNPNFKFIRNLNNGWMPYVTVGEIWTVGQHSEVKASGTKLDELTFRPYTEYGLGVQKMWSKGYDGYAEFLGHAGGRRGFLVNLGFRWTFN